MSPLIVTLAVFVFWLGPPCFLLIGAWLWFNARRKSQATPTPWNRFWSAIVVWGITGAAVWIAAVILLVVVSRAGNAGLWFVFTPWAFALGAAVGLYKLKRVLDA
jgi:hypothetical protein